MRWRFICACVCVHACACVRARVCMCCRFMDVSSHIRVECARYGKRLLVYHPHLVEDVACKCC